MLGQPPLVARYVTGDAQGEAFLAEKRVAAVAAAVGHDAPVLRVMGDENVLRVARPVGDDAFLDEPRGRRSCARI